MARVAFEFSDLLAFFVENDGGAVTPDHHRAAFAIDDHTDAGAFDIIHRLLPAALGHGFARQSAHFEDQRRFVVIVVNDLCVWRLAVVDVAKSAAEAPDSGREMINAERPPADVHLVNALVPKITVAGRPNPM